MEMVILPEELKIFLLKLTFFGRRIFTWSVKRKNEHLNWLSLPLTICGDLCVCVYIYIYIYIYTHTYIHTYMGCSLVLDNLVSSLFTIGRFMDHCAVLGRMVLCIIMGLISISWRFLILRLRDDLCFIFRLLNLFPWCGYTHCFGNMRWVW